MLLGPSNPAGVSSAMAAGLRRRGHRADVVVFEPHPFALPHDRLAGSYVARAREGLLAPLRYDVLHYQFGTSHLEFLDTAWARLTRRPLALVHFWGSDCRTREVALRLHPARARVVTGDARTEGTVRRRVRLGGRLCHAAVVPDLELASYVEHAFHALYVVPMPVALPELQPGALPPLEAEGPVVLHAPSKSAIKGTREILAALEAVAARRPLRIRTVEGVPHAQVLAEIARADIVVDQLNSETHGVFALEAMALGRPVLLEYRRDALAPFAQETPLIPVTAASLASTVEALCDDPERRAEVGAAGAAYVRAVHEADEVAARLERVYAHARGGPRGRFEATRAGIVPLG